MFRCDSSHSRYKVTHSNFVIVENCANSFEMVILRIDFYRFRLRVLHSTTCEAKGRNENLFREKTDMKNREISISLSAPTPICPLPLNGIKLCVNREQNITSTRRFQRFIILTDLFSRTQIIEIIYQDFLPKIHPLIKYLQKYSSVTFKRIEYFSRFLMYCMLSWGGEKRGTNRWVPNPDPDLIWIGN
jgi:hypothetical protein